MVEEGERKVENKENKKVKIVLFILLILIIIAIVILIGIYNKEIAEAAQELMGDPVLKETEGVTIVPTMQEQLGENTLWCGTFQLIWNDLKNEVAKQDIIFQPQLSIVEHLNKEEFNTDMLSEEYYYKKYGIATKELKEEIEKGIKEKFNENSSILDSFDWESGKNNYFLYAMLKREFEFNQEFDNLEKGTFAEKYENVRYFGIKEDTKQEVREQVRVLYYNSKDDLAILLQTKNGDEVILCKTPEGNNFNEIYQKIVTSNYTGNQSLTEKETLKIPEISIKEKKEYTDLAGKEFKLSTGETNQIEKAMQTIEFKLNKKGGEIKSEAGMMNQKAIMIPTEEVREFNFDSTFTLFLREEGKQMPYFAANIRDITKFQ